MENETIDSLVLLYSEAAAAHGKESDKADPDIGNQQADIIATVYSELRRRGRDAQLALLPLLKHTDPHVRGWTGAHALEFASAEGVATLEELRKCGGMLGFDAEITLEEWRKGKLR